MMIISFVQHSERIVTRLSPYENCYRDRVNKVIKLNDYAFCNEQSHCSKSTILEGKLRLGTSETKKSQLCWLKSLCFGGCDILLPSSLLYFVP